MILPVFDFSTTEYSGENVVLDQNIFNNLLREDIIHKVTRFNREYNRKTFRWVMSKGDVSGSNRKPFGQKKTGRAPQGDIRAPNLYHGGRAHGARPRDYYFPLNKKVRLLGLKCMLTSKFLEKKIIIVDSEKLEGDTLHNSLAFLKEQKAVFLTHNEFDENFAKEIENYTFVKHLTPDVRDSFNKLESQCITPHIPQLSNYYSGRP
jgi:large subunit ribosomal protein L4